MKTFLITAFAALVCATASRATAQADYTVSPQDVLTITVFGEAEFSGHYTIDQDGTFNYPQLGRIKAGGLTLRGLEDALKQQLADGYLKNPQVAVAVETYRSRRILVIGEVRSPGEYQLNGEMTLLAALARAGSTTPNAGHEVVIVRAAKKTPSTSPQGADAADSEILKVDLNDLQSGNAALNVRLQDGDTVNVPKALSVFVTGEVKSPGAYAVVPGTTVLQVLSLAGGITDRGSSSRVRILKTVNGKQTDIAAKMTDTINPGDTILVKTRFF